MSIRFACPCGQQLSAQEQYAGKRVRCSACGEIHTVPVVERGQAAPPPPVLVAAAEERIQFTCPCGQICRARPEMAGRNTRCPRCSTVLTIPANRIPGAAPAPRRPAALQANPPVQRAVRQPRYEDEDDSPPLRRSGQKGHPWPWIGVGAVLVLLLGGVGLWLLLRDSKDPDASPGGSGDSERKSVEVAADFDLVPRDAHFFATVRPAALLDTPLGTRLVDKFAVPLTALEVVERQVGMSRKEIARVTAVVPDFERGATLFWFVIQTTKPYDQAKIQAMIPGSLVKRYQGKEYRQFPGDYCL